MGGWGQRWASSKTPCGRGFYPSLRTGRSCVELEGRRVPCEQGPRTSPLPHSSPPEDPAASPAGSVCILSSLWCQEHKVMMEIVQLQEAAENYNLEPQERFRAWFWDMEQLSEDER